MLFCVLSLRAGNCHICIVSKSIIHQWLIGKRGWVAGVALYKLYGSDARLKSALLQGESPFRKQLLANAMSEMVADYEEDTTGAEIAPVQKEPEHQAVIVGDKQMEEFAVSEKEDPYRSEWLPPYIEMNNLCARLRDMPTKEERGKAAHKILRLEQICISIWERRDYYSRTGLHMPKPETSGLDIVTNPNVLHKKLGNLRSSISKANTEIRKNPMNAKASARLLKYEGERNFIIDQLNKIEDAY